jgi:hypothetical protein
MGRALHVRALCHRDRLGALCHVGMAGKVHDRVTPGHGALQIRVLGKISVFDPICLLGTSDRPPRPAPDCKPVPFESDGAPSTQVARRACDENGPAHGAG